jgi:hypothetical protein
MVFLGLLFAGCQTTYVHPTKTAADFQRDKFDCQTIAEHSAYSVGQAGDFWWINNRVHQCLQAKHGWRKQEVSDEGQSRQSSSSRSKSASNSSVAPPEKNNSINMDANTEVFPVLMPPIISNNIKRIAVLSPSDNFGTAVSAQLDYTLGVIRAMRPELVLVDRDSIEKVTQELNFQYGGRVDEETSTRIGKMVGADTLLLYRILPLDKTRAKLVQSEGGTITGGIEVQLIQVETGTNLFRQTVTAKTFFPPPNNGASWREEGVIRAHGIASEQAAAYGFSALGASLGVNPLGIVPFTEAGRVMDLLAGGLAEAVGLKKNDKIVAVNNRQFISWTNRIDLPAMLTVSRDGKELQLSVSRPPNP